MSKQLISANEVLELPGVDYSTIWRWMANGDFPLARKIGKTLRWVRSEIEAWINALPKNQCVHTGVKAGTPKRGRPTKITAARKRAAQRI